VQAALGGCQVGQRFLEGGEQDERRRVMNRCST
jgi:hypothetical protein